MLIIDQIHRIIEREITDYQGDVPVYVVVAETEHGELRLHGATIVDERVASFKLAVDQDGHHYFPSETLDTDD